MTIENDKRQMRVGDAVAVERGQTHSICNDGADELRFLCCCAPAYWHDASVLVF